MRIKISTTVYLIVSLLTTDVFALVTSVPKNYNWHQSFFLIHADTPPVEIYVEDSNGRITGADPSGLLDSFGTQNNALGGLAKIPLSTVVQDNVGDDENGGAPDTHTNWEMDILDSSKQTFEIHLKGLANAAATVYVGVGFSKGSKPQDVEMDFPVLVQSNMEREFEVAFDPIAKTIGITRLVKNEDLKIDVKTACLLHQITSNQVCGYLEKKAEAIQDALGRHRDEEAKTLLLSFLHSLGDSRPLNCQEEDDHGFVKEPALTILKEDAKAFLLRIKDVRG